MQVLLVEAEAKTGHEISLMLHHHSFTLHHTHLGEEGLNLATLYDHHIIIIDLDLPDMDGHEVLRRLRAKGVNTPVIIISKKRDAENAVTSLDLGADDHVVKPVYKDEMIARIHAIVRRSAGQVSSVMQIGEVCIKMSTRSAQVNGEDVHLTNSQYLLIEALWLSRGSALTRENLLDKLYNSADQGDYRTIDVMVGRIRKKLGEDSIKTIRGLGYQIKEPVEPKS